METCETVVIPNTAGGVRAAAQGLERFSSARGLPAAAVWPVQVALDEVLSNTVRHGYAESNPERQIEIVFDLRGGVLEVTVVDDAAPFNPLEAAPPSLDGPLEERSPGGLGIHLVRKLMDEVRYERAHERNRLVLHKRL